MATRKTGRPAGRPVDPDKAAAIIEAGWKLFLERGVEGVSVEAIAARARVSKVTFYRHFPDKISLFEAGVLHETEQIEAFQQVGGNESGSDLGSILRQFGLGLMGFLVSDPAVDFYNSLAGELRRHEELARRFYNVGPGRTRANLAAILEQAGQRGELDIEDPLEAAEHLFGLWQGFSNLQLSLGVETKEIRRTLETRVDRGLSVFLRAYASNLTISTEID